MGTCADYFISELVSVRRLPLITDGITSLLSNSSEFAILIDGWACHINITLYGAPQIKSEIKGHTVDMTFHVSMCESN